MRANLAALLVLSALTQGCGPIPVYTTADRASDKAGIGFFPIVAMDQSKRVYEQTWYELTVTRTLVPPSAADVGGASEKTKTQKTKADKDKSKADKAAKNEEPTYEQKIVRYTDDPAVAAKVLRAFSEQETPQDAWAQVKDSFVKKKTDGGWDTPGGAATVKPKDGATAKPHAAPQTAPGGVEANSAPTVPSPVAAGVGLPLLDAQPPEPFDLLTPKSGEDLGTLVRRQADKPPRLFLASVEHAQVQAPGRNVKYLNIQTPHGGTAQGSIQINQDGTLANASGQIQDTMPGKWVDAFSAITSAGLNAIGGIFKAAAENHPGEKAAQLDVKRVSRTYTITIQRPIEKSEADCGGLEKMLQGGGDAACRANLVVAMAPDQTGGDAGKKNDKKDADDAKEKKDADK